MSELKLEHGAPADLSGRLPKEVKTYKNLDAETKEILFETIKIFIKSAKDTVQSSVHEKIQEYQETLHLKP